MDFSKLPETEKNYNLQMSTETLKYVEHLWIDFLRSACVFEEKKKERVWKEVKERIRPINYKEGQMSFLFVCLFISSS